MYKGLLRLRASSVGSSIRSRIVNNARVPQLRTHALNSWSALQDTYYSTKDTFERHRVVFTICTSIGSLATAWAGYTLRHLHESRVEERLESIEKAMKKNYDIEEPEFKRLVSGSVSLPACVATAGTTLFIGYGLGWRGGRWYANRKFRKEQMKLLGQIKAEQWLLKFIRKPLIRPRLPGFLRKPLTKSRSPGPVKATETLPRNASVAHSPREIDPVCS